MSIERLELLQRVETHVRRRCRQQAQDDANKLFRHLPCDTKTNLLFESMVDDAAIAMTKRTMETIGASAVQVAELAIKEFLEQKLREEQPA